MRVDQYVTGFAPHDAIGRHALQVRTALRRAGWDSDIWAETVHAPLQREARPFQEDRGGAKVLLYQCSTTSALAPWLARRADGGERLLSWYHNITPAAYFERWHRPTADGMRRARAELAMLAPRTEMALSVSAFNQRELLSTGYRTTAVCPLLVDLDDYHRPTDARVLARLRRRRDRSGHQWLFVGRFAPNKCQHDVVGAFAAYRHLFDPNARLTLVGGVDQPRYHWAVERLVHQLDLGEAIEMLSDLDDAELRAHWSTADVFVGLSEHEGFCVPLLEAMELGVPVVAYAAAAVPETLGGASEELSDKGPVAVATAVAEALEPERRRQLVSAGRRRASHFSLARTSARLLEVLDRQLAPG